MLVFLAQDTRRDVEVQETRERGGGRGGGGSVTAVRGEDNGPRPTPFSACTLTLQHTIIERQLAYIQYQEDSRVLSAGLKAIQGSLCLRR